MTDCVSSVWFRIGRQSAENKTWKPGKLGTKRFRILRPLLKQTALEMDFLLKGCQVNTTKQCFAF
jgi:hypothetical protein